MFRSKIFIRLFAIVAAVCALPALAAKQAQPSGSIALEQGDVAVATQQWWPLYGDDVKFITTFEGRLSSKARLYITVVFLQDADVVYQWSGDLDFEFPLQDQGGTNLTWDGAEADCIAALVYREKRGKQVDLQYLDEVEFIVHGAT